MLELRNIFKHWLGKKPTTTSVEPDEFELEALDGWNNHPESVQNFDKIMASMDEKIDRISGALSSGTPAEDEKKTIPRFWGKWLAMAATVLLIVGTSVYIFKHQKTPEQQLFTTYFSPRVHPDAPLRGENSSSLAETEMKAMYAYEAEDFKKSISYYEVLVNEYPKSSKHALFLSISYLGVNNAQKAINVLSRLNNVDENYKTDIAWYLALAYLKNNERNAARIILEKLAAEDSFYSESAKEILNALGK